MKVRTISYQKAFVIGAYLQEKIGIEVELDDEDNSNESFQKCKDLVNSWGFKFEPINGFMNAEVQPVLDRRKELTEIAIDNAATIEQLDLLMGDAAKYGLAKELNEKKRKLNETR